MAYYQRARLYTDGERQSPHMHEVAPQKLTLRGDLRPYFDRGQLGVNRTAFKEIGIVPPGRVRSQAVKKLLASKIERRKVSAEDFAAAMFGAMKKAIVEGWKPDKVHIVQHSSGWDSRLISLALRALKNERGADWLGDVLFVEISGEHGPFKRIMKAQGWKDYTVYNEGAKPNEHHERSFHFADAWRKLNGYCSYPSNLNWDPFEWLHERGVIPGPEKCQILTGYGANEIGNWVATGRGLRRYADFIYYHNALSHYALWGGGEAWLHPYYHLDYIRTWVANGGGRRGFYRRGVVCAVMPEMAQIKDVPKGKKFKLGYRNVSKRILDRCVADYEASWYGQNVQPDVNPTSTINFNDWWGHWSLASFCEHLLEEGHEIAA